MSLELVFAGHHAGADGHGYRAYWNCVVVYEQALAQARVQVVGGDVAASVRALVRHAVGSTSVWLV